MTYVFIFLKKNLNKTDDQNWTRKTMTVLKMMGRREYIYFTSPTIRREAGMNLVVCALVFFFFQRFGCYHVKINMENIKT